MFSKGGMVRFFSPLLVICVLLSLGFAEEVIARHRGFDRGSPGSSSNFEELKLPLVRCGDTATYCGLNDPESPLLGTDPLAITQGSRVRVKKFGRLEVRVEGAVPQKDYDVYIVYTPGGVVDCSSFDPDTCTADCTDPQNPTFSCGFEPANCSVDCTDPGNPVISCSLDPANCTSSVVLVPVGSFTTDSRGRGELDADISDYLDNKVDSIHVLITDFDDDTSQIGDVPRQFITGVRIR
jgi:hypothetical protein